ncbi:MAG TPA: peptide ABC transporter substrate-binding protein [Candidatus Paceibacterota bacterium]|nr:peptide ABC transporter substrate-binding protein [Candidatus Paceibacterota bacterium]
MILAGLAIFGLWKVNSAEMMEVPVHGGTLSEGMVGIPRFINPVLASSETDRDLTKLVYSGLLTVSPDGTYVPDLAESYQVSDDGLTYTVKLKDNLKWQDGEPVTADDVLFTIQKIQDDKLNSPNKANWVGVTVEKIDDRTIVFHLREPYGPFLENLTVGILPKHLWDNKTPQEFLFSTYNIHPVGTGPYKMAGILYQDSGVPKEYQLTAFSGYAGGNPYIQNLKISFFKTEDDLLSAIRDGRVESAAEINPEEAASLADDGFTVKTAPLLRIFAVFFNQSQNPIFADKSVREALELAVDKNAIIEQALSGYGTAINGPIPPGTVGFQSDSASSSLNREDAITKAKSLLEADGWTYDETEKVYKKGEGSDAQTLAFTLETSDVPELKKTAQILQENWKMIGANVTIKSDEVESLNQNVIRPRKYDALLFGQITGRNPDLYAFWHSSERLDPGLNVAMYTNADADKILETARQISNLSERAEKDQEFSEILAQDHPAIFLYAPEFLYVVPKKLRGMELGGISVSSDRFSDIAKWYVDTEHVWKFFTS